jgi:hypothetical protein
VRNAGQKGGGRGGGGVTLEDDARNEEGEGGAACCVDNETLEHAAATLHVTKYALYVPSGTKRNRRDADAARELPNTWPTATTGASAFVR